MSNKMPGVRSALSIIRPANNNIGTHRNDRIRIVNHVDPAAVRIDAQIYCILWRMKRRGRPSVANHNAAF